MDTPTSGSVDVDRLAFMEPIERLGFTGERYTPDISGPIRHQHHHRYLFSTSFCADRDVLDIACGEGYGSALLANVASNVRGMDIDPDAIASAKRNYSAPNLTFLQGNAAQLDERQAFDVVVSFETIEHIVAHDDFMEGVRRAMRPGGLLIISSPDRTIFTDADHHENEFHLRELDRTEFKDLIGRYFANMAVFEQDSIAGSFIGAEGGASASLQLFSTEDGRDYQQTRGAPHAHYLIALASDAPLPPIPASALHDASWIREAQDRELHSVALAREVAVRDAEIMRLNQELELHSVALAREVAVRDAEIVRLNQELVLCTKEGMRLSTALGMTQAEVSNLRTDVVRMQVSIDEYARQLDHVFASTSWRLTAPLRRLARTTGIIRRRMPAVLIPAPASSPPTPASNNRSRVLFIDWGVPTPDQDSGSLDLWHQLGLFQSLGFEVAFMPLVQGGNDARYLSALRQAGVTLLVDDAGILPEIILQQKAADFDLIFLNRVHVALRLTDHVRRYAPNARIVFNTVDLHFLREEREAVLEGSPEKAQAAAQRRNDELHLVTRADATIVLSDTEERLLNGLAPGAAVHVIPFARNTSDHVPSFGDRYGVVFVGGFLHAPNIDAVNWLVADIWPKVRLALPTAKLEIVGSNAPTSVLNLHAPQCGIHVRGFVPDLDAVLSNARLTVAPLRFGAGIKGKVAMSLAAGVPCVGTPIAAEGMGVVDGESIVIGHTAEEFAAGIVRVHQDAAFWGHLSEGGQRLTRACYAFECTGQRLLNLVNFLGVPIPEGSGNKLQNIKPFKWLF